MEAPLSDLNEFEYYQRRHEQECERAERAQKAEVRSIHSQLADEYAKRLRSVELGVSHPVLRIAGSS